MASGDCLPCLSATWPLSLLASSSRPANVVLLFGCYFLISLVELCPATRVAGYLGIVGSTAAHVCVCTYLPDGRCVERFVRADPGAHPLTDFPDGAVPMRPAGWLLIVLAHHTTFMHVFLWASMHERQQTARVYERACAAWHGCAAALTSCTLLMLACGRPTPATLYKRPFHGRAGV